MLRLLKATLLAAALTVFAAGGMAQDNRVPTTRAAETIKPANNSAARSRRSIPAKERSP